MKKTHANLIASGLMMAASVAQASSAESAPISVSSALPVMPLLEPKFEGTASLYEALQNRRSVRKFADRSIEEQDLSNLLWSAAGVNRSNGRKTVPLLGDIAIYVAMASGTYRYLSEQHALQQVLTEDIRSQLSAQKVVATAPVVLIMTIDDESFSAFMKTAMEKAHGMDFYHGNQVAFSAQNVYLYAGTNNMNAVVIGGLYQDKIDQLLQLGEHHHSYLLQLVGYKN